MRYLVLVGTGHFDATSTYTKQDPNTSEPLLGHARARMREDEV